MDCNFKIILEPRAEDKKLWGVLAHVSPEWREKIKNSSAGQFKQYIKYINQDLKQLNKGKIK